MLTCLEKMLQTKTIRAKIMCVSLSCFVPVTGGGMRAIENENCEKITKINNNTVDEARVSKRIYCEKERRWLNSNKQKQNSILQHIIDMPDA